MVVHTVATCQRSIIWNLIQEHSECSHKFESAEKRALNPRKRRAERGEGYSGFQVTGMIKGFFGFEIFDFRICSGRKILAGSFWAALFIVGTVLGIQNNLKFHVYHLTLPGNFNGSAWDFLAG